MDLHGILSDVFLGAFWVGLLLTVVMSALSGAFHSEFGAGSAIEGGHAGDFGGTDIEAGTFDSANPTVGWVDAQFPGASPLSPTVLFSALTALGGVGYLSLVRWDLGPGMSLAVGLLASLGLGAATFFVLDVMLRRLQSTSHVTASSLIGTKAVVQIAVGSGGTGSIMFEARGTRMTVPARAIDASAIPAGAEVEIRRVDGGVYVVEETRESWLARAKSKPDHERWSNAS